MHKSKRAKWFSILAVICLFLSFVWSNPYGRGGMQIFFWIFIVTAGIFFLASKLRNASKNWTKAPKSSYEMPPPPVGALPMPSPWTRTEAVYENGRPVQPPYIKERQ